MSRLNLHHPSLKMNENKVEKFLKVRETWLVAATIHVSKRGKEWCLQNANSYLEISLPYMNDPQIKSVLTLEEVQRKLKSKQGTLGLDKEGLS